MTKESTRLVAELRTQLSHPADCCVPGSEAVEKGIVPVRTGDYHKDLRVLLKDLKGGWKNAIDAPTLPRRDLLWKLPASVSDSSPHSSGSSAGTGQSTASVYLDANVIQKDIERRQKFKATEGSNDVRKVWHEQKFSPRSKYSQSSLMILQDGFSRRRDLHIFGLEVVSALQEKKESVIHLLGNLSSDFYKHVDNARFPSGDDVLRQLALQSLQVCQRDMPNTSIYLAHMVQAVQDRDWLLVMARALRCRQLTHIVVNTSILRNLHAHSESWPSLFSHLLDSLPRNTVKVIIITDRPMDRTMPPNSGAYILREQTGQGRKMFVKESWPIVSVPAAKPQDVSDAFWNYYLAPGYSERKVDAAPQTGRKGAAKRIEVVSSLEDKSASDQTSIPFRNVSDSGNRGQSSKSQTGGVQEGHGAPAQATKTDSKGLSEKGGKGKSNGKSSTGGADEGADKGRPRNQNTNRGTKDGQRTGPSRQSEVKHPVSSGSPGPSNPASSYPLSSVPPSSSPSPSNLPSYNTPSSSPGPTGPWFNTLESTTHQTVYGHENFSPSAYDPVKVAILDTGFAYTEPGDKKALKPYAQRIKKYASFIEGMKDQDARADKVGHGTAVIVQLIKTCPNAEVYVCQIAAASGVDSNSPGVSRGITPDKDAVEKAIRKAASSPPEGWGVDIINMSFGWPFNDHAGVDRAVKLAAENGVHMFASTSNTGLLGPPNDILYPSRSNHVVAVDAADGFGKHADSTASSTSQYGRGRRFSAPGVGLTCPVGSSPFLTSQKTWTGSSFACPIAAGCCALLLEFARQPPLGQSPSAQASLRDMAAMMALMRNMSSEKGVDRFKFLVPWKLIGKAGEPRMITSYLVVDELRKEFGQSIGSEIEF